MRQANTRHSVRRPLEGKGDGRVAGTQRSTLHGGIVDLTPCGWTAQIRPAHGGSGRSVRRLRTTGGKTAQATTFRGPTLKPHIQPQGGCAKYLSPRKQALFFTRGDRWLHKVRNSPVKT